MLFPDSFLTTGEWGPKLLSRAVPEKRSYDNVTQNLFESAEDEIALMKMTGGLSCYGAIMFPDRAAEYEKYIDFLEATPAERRRFKESLVLMIKKIMLATGGKRVVVKSCPHSARIRMILDVFPDFPRVDTPQFKGSFCQQLLDPKLAFNIRQTSSKLGCSPYVLALSALAFVF